ncbi:helix-turn-helix domain-containing protein [Shewanella algae]
MRALRAEGVSLRKIANECGCSLSTVQRALGMSA